MSSATSLSNKRKMKILPQHMSQHANRMAGSKGISGSDYVGVHPEDDANGFGAGGALEVEQH